MQMKSFVPSNQPQPQQVPLPSQMMDHMNTQQIGQFKVQQPMKPGTKSGTISQGPMTNLNIKSAEF